METKLRPRDSWTSALPPAPQGSHCTQVSVLWGPVEPQAPERGTHRTSRLSALGKGCVPAHWDPAEPLPGVSPSPPSDSKSGNSRAAVCLSPAWAARDQSVVVHQWPPPSGPEAGAARLHPTPTRWFPFHTPVSTTVFPLTHLPISIPCSTSSDRDLPGRVLAAALQAKRLIPGSRAWAELGTPVQMQHYLKAVRVG